MTTTWTTDFNQPATVTDALGHTTSFTYDALGRLTEARDPLGNLTRFEHNASGQVTRILDPRGQATDLGYDLFDLRSVTDPLGRVATFSTDLLGRVAAVTDPLGNLTRYEYGLLEALLQRPGAVLSRAQLMDRVWSDALDSGDRTVDTHIKTLRAKLREIDAATEDTIRTHRGLGYSIDVGAA